MKRAGFFALALVLFLALAGACLVSVLTPGVSTRRPPLPAEAFLARRLRHLAIPGRATAEEPRPPIRRSSGCRTTRRPLRVVSGNDGRDGRKSGRTSIRKRRT